jgi:hypothetical protein
MGLWFAFMQPVWTRGPCEWSTHHARNGETPRGIGVASSRRGGRPGERRRAQHAVSQHPLLRVGL